MWSVGTRVVANTTGSTPVKVGTMIALIIHISTLYHLCCHGRPLNSPCENRNKNVISKRKILCEVLITYSPPYLYSHFFFQFEIRLQTFEGVTPLNNRRDSDAPQQKNRCEGMDESCVSPLSEPVGVQSVSPSVSWVIQFSYLTPVQTHHSVSQSYQTTQT